MDLTRRELVRAAGLGVAAVALSCGTLEQAAEDQERTKEEDEMSSADEPMPHTVFIRRYGQYVATEVESASQLSYRGRLEVLPRDTIEIINQDAGTVRLVFPLILNENKDGFTALRLLDYSNAEIPKGGRDLEDMEVITLDRGNTAKVEIPTGVAHGRYEYSIMYDSSILGEPRIVSRWAHAIAGSSSEFIIRGGRR